MQVVSSSIIAEKIRSLEKDRVAAANGSREAILFAIVTLRELMAHADSPAMWAPGIIALRGVSAR